MEKLRSVGLGQTPTKTCGKCAEVKDLEDFYADKSNKADGRTWDCRDCRKKRSREAYRAVRSRNPEARRNESFKSKYGITIDEWDQRFIDQGGRCMICSVSLPCMGNIK